MESLSPREQILTIHDDKATPILKRFGTEAILHVYGMEGLGHVEMDRKGRVCIVCPESDGRPGREGRHIYALPKLDLNRVVDLYGSEEETIKQLYAPLGYKNVKFVKKGDRIEYVTISPTDLLRVLPGAGKLAIAAAVLTFGGMVYRVCNDSPGGRAALEFSGDKIEEIFGTEEQK